MSGLVEVRKFNKLIKVINMLLVLLIISSAALIVFSFYAHEVLDPMQLGYFLQYSGVIFLMLMATAIIRLNLITKRKDKEKHKENKSKNWLD